ncbi:hypothetical protein [Nostoc sp. UHCC 0870]|jgi:hypothetical protein|uniref:hypothetical protein n=1 Tax=Nostoc sp. UHCC 0870 TaxID=2914041 RepID=UPI001EE06976|nr:hypothetical protein [Nostoc sp. UHCC 0870]UKO98452.1 hypothetical protein L6494_01545 [Nostoc sp. UHCC 0870]
MISPVTNFIRCNVEKAKEVGLKWENASSSELRVYCLEILSEIGCSDTELPDNLQTREQQLNFITGFASFAFGEVQNVQSCN